MKTKPVFAGLLFLVASLTLSPAPWSFDTAYQGAPVSESRQLDRTVGQGPDQISAELMAGSYAGTVSACLEIIERSPAEVSAYSWLCQALEHESGPARAVATLDATRRLTLQANAHPGNTFYQYGLGLLYKLQKDFPLARQHLRKSILLSVFWQACEELVNCYMSEADIKETADFLRVTLKLFPSNPFLLQALGLCHFYSSEYSDALVALERARTIFHVRGDKRAEGKCLVNLSDVHTYSNDYPGALEKAEAGLRLAVEAGDKILESECRETCAFVWIDLGNDQKGYDFCRQALALSRETACLKLEILCLRTMGVINLERGNLAKADELLIVALEYYRRKDILRSQAVCLYWLTIVHKDRGDYSRAMADAKEALGISRRIGFKTSEAFHLTAIGDIHLLFGNYERALEYNKEALDIAERYIGKWSREECLNTIGFVYAELNDFSKALQYFKAAYDYIEHIGHRREEASCLYNIGFASLKLGNLRSASEFFTKSLAEANRTGKKIIQVHNYNRLGDLYRQTGEWEKSRQSYDRAQAIGSKIGQLNVIWETYAGLGALMAAQKQFEPAIAYYKKAVGIIEDLRVQLLLREYSAGFFESKVPIYEALINLLFEKQEAEHSATDLEECLYYAEKAKARSFLDDLRKARIEFGPLSQAEAEELGIISLRISRLSAELSNALPGPEAQADLRDKLEKAEDDFQAFVETTKAKNSVYATAAYQEPRRLSEIRERLLDKETGLIEYFVAGDYLYTFVVTADGFSVHRSTPPESQDTLKLAKNYIRLVSSKEITCSDSEPAGRRLYRALFGGIARECCAGLKNLIIIPDRTLNYLPFETLVSDEGKKASPPGAHFLLEDYQISYAPSISTLVSILERGERPEAGMDLLSVGDPIMNGFDETRGREKFGGDVLLEYYQGQRFVLQPLDFASQEMRTISGLVDRNFRSILSRGEATEERLKALNLASFKILHFATHSLIDENAASRSALVLTRDSHSAEDGFLQAGEIYNLKLNADLVVLSACQTAGGKMEKGEGIQGLGRAFFCAGSKSVMASLWNINDRSTAHFMKLFYGCMAEGKAVQEAIRLAKIKMCRSGDSPPYYWAAFVLIGQGNARIPLHRASFWSRILHL
jgi:CHAT domain-containing protein/Tfp pilus assembly protein PilF